MRNRTVPPDSLPKELYHDSLPPQLRCTVLIFLTLILADTLLAQVIIRERVEIKPQVEAAEPAKPSLNVASGGLLFVGSNNQTVHSTVPGLEIDLAVMDQIVPMPPPGRVVAGLYIAPVLSAVPETELTPPQVIMFDPDWTAENPRYVGGAPAVAVACHEFATGS